MTAYAQNASASGGGYASLTSSLLARKGEALPAVDAVAHEGVDVEMRPMQPPMQPANSQDSTSSYSGDSDPLENSDYQQNSVRLVHSTQAAPISGDAPDIWALPRVPRQRSSAGRPVAHKPVTKAEPKSGPYSDLLNRKASVTLKMPTRDLVRLRVAARDLDMSCQNIILEALECYLDANGVPSDMNDSAILRETARMIKRARARRQS
ncbi:hypothetical protein [Hyphococcus lacteus]|uniref:Ribbon-helix-helix protein CopG domain-containing protein n=1 Tax=Hyphococcus lacteus TaxID=3143536 RepID=A0ABV3Z090_9PROT